MEFNKSEWFVLFFIILSGIFLSAFHLAGFLFTAVGLSIQSFYIAVKDMIGGKDTWKKTDQNQDMKFRHNLN